MSRDIPISDIPRLVRDLRAFIGGNRLHETARRLAVIDTEHNPFRSLLSREKQPLMEALRELDRATMRGGRPLKKAHFNDSIRELAYLAMLCARVRTTLPSTLGQHHAAKLTDMYGKRLSILTEWETADFYLEKGFTVRWTELGQPGPEFSIAKGDLKAEIECKRYARAGMEKLKDRDATSIAEAFFVAMQNSQQYGQVRVTVESIPPPPIEQISQTLAQLLSHPPVDEHIAGFGHVFFERDLQHKTIAEISNELQTAPHDCRKYVVGGQLTNGQGPARILYLKGPRLTAEQFMNGLEDKLQEAARKQLRGNVAGFLIVEIEDLGIDIYRDKIIFDQIPSRIFAQNPHVGSVVWRTSHQFEIDANSVSPRIDAMAVRNANCTFPKANQIPLVQ